MTAKLEVNATTYGIGAHNISYSVPIWFSVPGNSKRWIEHSSNLEDTHIKIKSLL